MTRGAEIIWQQRDAMLSGAAETLELAVSGGLLAAALGAVIFAALISRLRALRLVATILVDAMRCMPFMLFVYLLYYGLPSAGLTLGNFTVGVLALALYHASYIAELLRGAWRELPKETIEAGVAFGFHGLGLLRIILPPVVITAIPMLGNQFVQVIKDSAFLIIIAVEELTFTANEIQSTFYVPFASFIVAVLIYWGLCAFVEAGVTLATGYTAMRR